MSRSERGFRRVPHGFGLVAALAAMAIAAVVLVFANQNAGMMIHVAVESRTSGGVVAVYYDDGGGFREEASVRRELRKGKHRYELPIPAAQIRGLRIDPGTHDQVVFVGEVEARSGGKVVKQFAPGALIGGGDVASTHVDPAARGVWFEVKKGGSDPFFYVSDSALRAAGGFSRIGAVLLTVAFATLGLVAVLGLRADRPTGIGALPAVQLALTAGVVIAMAILGPTSYSASPDEFSHLEAGRYYLDRWMPPAIGDPATLRSYSAYGFSYLAELDVVYFFAAKFVTALEFTGIGEVVRFRLFNLGLLGLCILMAMQGRLQSLVILPVLCTPQAWYVFGYFNADAFALVTTLLLGAWVAAWFERNPTGSGAAPRIDLRTALVVGGLLALALLSKRTFYPFIVFIAGYALWKCGLRAMLAYVLGFAGLVLLALWHYAAPVTRSLPGLFDPPMIRAAVGIAALGLVALGTWLLLRPPGGLRAIPRTLVVAGLVAAVLVGSRLALEFTINGTPSDKSQALLALAERIAQPNFRPSMMGQSNAYFGLALAARGVGLQEVLLGKYAWIQSSLTSFFGVYGYMSIFGPEWLYRAQYALALLLLAATLGNCLRDREARGVMWLGLGSAGLVILLSVMNSWTRDLQPQGRYLFAVLPILGVLIAEAHRGEPLAGREPLLKVAFVAVAALWVLGLVSFGFVGLPGIARA